MAAMSLLDAHRSLGADKGRSSVRRSAIWRRLADSALIDMGGRRNSDPDPTWPYPTVATTSPRLPEGDATRGVRFQGEKNQPLPQSASARSPVATKSRGRSGPPNNDGSW